MPKIFISYSIKDKVLAGKLKRLFEEYEDVECFIAHDDIAPGSRWEREILRNLKSADYFLPLQTEDLKNSFWCQQEAGFAIARGVAIIPLIPDSDGIDPIGFYAKLQGFRIKRGSLRDSVRRWLIKEEIIDELDADELEKRLLLFEASDSFAEAEKNTLRLLQLEEQFKKGDISRIIETTLNNDQILNSWGARRYLKPFFERNAKSVSRNQLEEFLRAD